MSGDTHFRLSVRQISVRSVRRISVRLRPTILRPSPSPPPTSFLSDVSPSESLLRSFSFIFFILSTTSLFFPFRPLFLFVFLINCGSHVYFYCHRVSPVSQLYFIYRQCCTLAGLHPFLLGSPARCANYCSILCQYIYLGSPASFCQSGRSRPYIRKGSPTEDQSNPFKIHHICVP